MVDMAPNELDQQEALHEKMRRQKTVTTTAPNAFPGHLAAHGLTGGCGLADLGPDPKPKPSWAERPSHGVG